MLVVSIVADAVVQFMVPLPSIVLPFWLMHPLMLPALKLKVPPDKYTAEPYRARQLEIVPPFIVKIPPDPTITVAVPLP